MSTRKKEVADRVINNNLEDKLSSECSGEAYTLYTTTPKPIHSGSVYRVRYPIHSSAKVSSKTAIYDDGPDHSVLRPPQRSYNGNFDMIVQNKTPFSRQKNRKTLETATNHLWTKNQMIFRQNTICYYMEIAAISPRKL